MFRRCSVQTLLALERCVRQRFSASDSTLWPLTQDQPMAKRVDWYYHRKG